MKMYLFLVADTYNTRGWSILAVEESDHWTLKYTQEREDSVLLKEFDVMPPTSSELVKIGLAKAEEMKEELAEKTLVSTQRIKEYESKFLSLDAPAMETDELS